MLNRPDQFNALTGEMTIGLVDTLRSAVASDDVRVVLLTGTRMAFSAGADLEGDDPAEKYDEQAVDAAAILVDAVIACDKPVVCGLNGIAAALNLAFTKIGLMPDGGATATVVASIGRPVFGGS